MSEPAVILPRRVIGKARSQTAFSGVERGDAIRRDDNVNLNQSINTQRTGASAAATMRVLFEVNGLVGTAISSLVGMANTPLRLAAYDTATQEFSRAGLLAAEAVVSSLTTPWDYTGYTDHRALDAMTETMLLEVALTGGVGSELVLDKFRLPRDLNIFGYDTITWVSKGEGRKVPTQKGTSGDDIVLDLPTVFVGESLKTARRKYALPLLHSGLMRVFHYESFLEDSWKVVRQAGSNRLVVSLDYDKVLQSAPPEIQGDPAQLSSYLENVRIVHEDVLKGLSPEDALVVYNVAEVDTVKVSGDKADIRELIEALAGLAASALKSNPSMLGLRIGGSQNTSTTEAMLAIKTAELIRKPVQEVLSKLLTLAVRLYGVDVYIEAAFEEIDLRPSSELEAYKAILQARVLELLSLGRITNDEAQFMLGLGSLPASAEDLSGTGFYGSKAPDAAPVAATNSRNRQISPDTPNSAGGKDQEQKP
jgi:hypothetical protein